MYNNQPANTEAATCNVNNVLNLANCGQTHCPFKRRNIVVKLSLVSCEKNLSIRNNTYALKWNLNESGHEERNSPTNRCARVSLRKLYFTKRHLHTTRLCGFIIWIRKSTRPQLIGFGRGTDASF